MALGSNVTAVFNPTDGLYEVYPASLTAQWVTIIDAGGADDQDAATITNPTTQIVLSTRHILLRGNQGTILLLRLVYDDGLTSITNPVVKVFGRSLSTEIWQLLKTKAAALTGTLTTATSTDVTDATNNYTTPDYDTQSWDCLGCAEILVGIQTALAATGTVTTAYIQAKII